MAGRERERERASRAQPPPRENAVPRTNEYFVPKDGIDREVITADICRYLGNDALVRPGTYENPQTRVAQQGYFITAYRNLTTEMIADLKADSQRWEAERRQTASRGQPQNVEYRSSTTHQSRQYYGPTEATPQVPAGYAAGGYQPPTTSVQQSQVYDSSQYQSSAYSGLPAQGKYGPAQGYVATTQAYTTQEPYYVGSNMDIDTQPRSERSSTGVPRTTAVQGYAAPSNYQQGDRNAYYSPVASSTSSYQQPPDPYYGRAPQGSTYDSTNPDSMYDQRYQDPRAQPYQDTSTYTQAPMPPATNPTAGPQSTRRDRGERDDRDSRHHNRRR